MTSVYRIRVRYNLRMKRIILTTLLITFLPRFAFAQQTIENIFINILGFFNGILVPFMFAIAFLIFVFNAIRFFVLQSTNEDGREKARKLVTYSLLAFVFLFTFWGILNMFVESLGLECSRYEAKKATSDYVVNYMPPGPTVSICP